MNAPPRRLRAGGLELELGSRPLLMGIVNASPDSFSDGGLQPRRSTRRSRSASSCSPTGADIIDVGGESASTGRPPVEVAEEIERVVPLVERLAGDLGALVSVDTYKPQVAARRDRRRRADRQRRQRPARPGAGRGLREHRRRARADAHAAAPRERRQEPELYEDVVEEVLAFLRERIELALRGRRRARAADRRPRTGLRQDARADDQAARRGAGACTSSAARC